MPIRTVEPRQQSSTASLTFLSICQRTTFMQVQLWLSEAAFYITPSSPVMGPVIPCHHREWTIPDSSYQTNILTIIIYYCSNHSGEVSGYQTHGKPCALPFDLLRHRPTFLNASTRIAMTGSAISYKYFNLSLKQKIFLSCTRTYSTHLEALLKGWLWQEKAGEVSVNEPLWNEPVPLVFSPWAAWFLPEAVLSLRSIIQKLSWRQWKGVSEGIGFFLFLFFKRKWTYSFLLTRCHWQMVIPIISIRFDKLVWCLNLIGPSTVYLTCKPYTNEMTVWNTTIKCLDQAPTLYIYTACIYVSYIYIFC